MHQQWPPLDPTLWSLTQEVTGSSPFYYNDKWKGKRIYVVSLTISLWLNHLDFLTNQTTCPCLLTTWVSVWANNLSILPNYDSAAFPSLPDLKSSVFQSVTWVNKLSFVTLRKTDELRFDRLGKAVELWFGRFEVFFKLRLIYFTLGPKMGCNSIWSDMMQALVLTLQIDYWCSV